MRYIFSVFRFVFLISAIFGAHRLQAQPVQRFTPNPAAEISPDMPFDSEADALLWLVTPRNGSATVPMVLRGERGLDRIQPLLSPLRDAASGRSLQANAVRIRE